MGTMACWLTPPGTPWKMLPSLTALPRNTVLPAVKATRGAVFSGKPPALSVTQMLFASRYCQHDLVLALPEARPVFIRAGFVAMHT